jgi:hypothetical protein
MRVADRFTQPGTLDCPATMTDGGEKGSFVCHLGLRRMQLTISEFLPLTDYVRVQVRDDVARCHRETQQSFD